jgi:predicted DNA-binding transcriptional regulator AlpA
MKEKINKSPPSTIVLLEWTHVIGQCKLSRAEIYRRIKLKTFPTPVKLSPRKNVWPEHIIQKWLAEQLKRAKY